MVPDTVASFNLRRNYAKAIDDLFALACCLTNYLLLRKLAPLTGCFLIVEYERSKPSSWVPFPVGFLDLCELFRATGLERIEKVATLRSRFGGTMYSAFATRP
jgi:hypothetical protein